MNVPLSLPTGSQRSGNKKAFCLFAIRAHPFAFFCFFPDRFLLSGEPLKAVTMHLRAAGTLVIAALAFCGAPPVRCATDRPNRTTILDRSFRRAVGRASCEAGRCERSATAGVRVYGTPPSFFCSRTRHSTGRHDGRHDGYDGRPNGRWSHDGRQAGRWRTHGHGCHAEARASARRSHYEHRRGAFEFQDPEGSFGEGGYRRECHLSIVRSRRISV